MQSTKTVMFRDKGAICTAPSGAMEALNGLLPMDLMIQSEAWSAAHRPWSLRCWSDLHANQGHSCILTRLQKPDTIFNTGFDIKKPIFNLEPKYRFTMLTRGECARGPGTPLAVKGLVWFTDGSRSVEGSVAGIYGQSVGRRLSISLGKYATDFQVDVYAIFACVQETETQDRPENVVVFVLIARRL